jgi:hypothetical protein
VSANEELLEIKISGSGLETEITAVGIRHADHVATSIRKKLAITSPTSGGRSVGIVRSRTQTMEFSFLVYVGILLDDLKTSTKNRSGLGAAPSEI